MGQGEVLEMLEKLNQPTSIMQLYEHLKGTMNYQSVSRCCKSLEQQHYIKGKLIPTHCGKHKKFKHKHILVYSLKVCVV